MTGKKIIIVIMALLLIGCASEQTKKLMGTYVTITVYDADKDKANNAISSAFLEIERIDNLLSNYNNDSEVYLLNTQGFVENPSEDLIANIQRARFYSNLSSGAFDITVQPLLDLYTYSFGELQRPPNKEEITNVLRLVNYDYIFMKEGLILLRGQNMSITLGGIAKGYAVDKAIEILRNSGIENALVNAGGDMKTIGTKGKDNWQIALQNPREKDEFITIIPLKDKAVVTSGDYERYFDENKTFHHIVDPRTGYSAASLISVTIISEHAVDADAIATSVFVLGKEKGLELIESLDDVEGLLITREKEIVKSCGFDY
ncbi:MAG: FAD:protein FMN transferase [Nanoarchaeota archaeon]